MFLKKIFKKIKILFIICSILLISYSAKGEKSYLKSVDYYFNNINEFSASFLQIQNNEVSEGKIFFKNKRLRIEYTSPSNIIFILKKNKAMFYNKDLQEVEYFNPSKTAGQLLLNLFNKEKFLSDAKIFYGKGYFYLAKKIYFDNELNDVEIYFEKQPLLLRKVQIINSLGLTSLTILNLNFNPNLNNKIFSLVNPTLG